MTAYYGDVATDYQAGGLANAVTSGLIDGRVKCNLESYTILGTEAAASTLDVGAELPKGARVIAIVVYVSAAQTALTLSIGDDASATRYASASTSLQAIGTYVYSGKNYTIGTASGDEQILLTTGGATATAGQLEVAVLYAID